MYCQGQLRREEVSARILALQLCRVAFSAETGEFGWPGLRKEIVVAQRQYSGCKDVIRSLTIGTLRRLSLQELRRSLGEERDSAQKTETRLREQARIGTLGWHRHSHMGLLRSSVFKHVRQTQLSRSHPPTPTPTHPHIHVQSVRESVWVCGCGL